MPNTFSSWIKPPRQGVQHSGDSTCQIPTCSRGSDLGLFGPNLELFQPTASSRSSSCTPTRSATHPACSLIQNANFLNLTYNVGWRHWILGGCPAPVFAGVSLPVPPSPQPPSPGRCGRRGSSGCCLWRRRRRPNPVPVRLPTHSRRPCGIL